MFIETLTRRYIRCSVWFIPVSENSLYISPETSPIGTSFILTGNPRPVRSIPPARFPSGMSSVMRSMSDISPRMFRMESARRRLIPVTFVSMADMPSSPYMTFIKLPVLSATAASTEREMTSDAKSLALLLAAFMTTGFSLRSAKVRKTIERSDRIRIIIPIRAGIFLLRLRLIPSPRCQHMRRVGKMTKILASDIN